VFHKVLQKYASSEIDDFDVILLRIVFQAVGSVVSYMTTKSLRF